MAVTFRGGIARGCWSKCTAILLFVGVTLYLSECLYVFSDSVSVFRCLCVCLYVCLSAWLCVDFGEVVFKTRILV